jgi:FtsP/CotA-like multicopper oxidase with cupredoxin domain
MYVNENNRVDMGLDAQFIEISVVWEGGGNRENRKMFSHRERGFPTRRVSKNGNSKVLFREGRSVRLRYGCDPASSNLRFQTNRIRRTKKHSFSNSPEKLIIGRMEITLTRVDVSGCDLHP